MFSIINLFYKTTGDGPGTSHEPSGGAAGHGSTNPRDIHEPIEHDGHPDTPAAPQRNSGIKKGGISILETIRVTSS